MSGRKIPAISVIIPMYNAEKYIGECLESILNQTFQDFEVIVVDDCSTDNSCKIVEDYEKKFNVGEHGTLRLVRLETNSGAPGVPNNTGLALSRGEYISFIESDDAITNTAYEELYPIAKKFDADVVQCEGFYEIAETSKIDKNNLKPTHYKKTALVTEPTLITDDLKERVTALVRGDFFLNVWTKLIRRDFIVQNNLKMLSINHHDTSYSCLLVCAAKRYVLAPNVINFYRVVENSMSHKKENVEKTVKKYCKTFFESFNYVNEFLSTQENFKKNIDLKYTVLDIIAREFMNVLLKFYVQNPGYLLDGFVQSELKKLSDSPQLTSFIFNRMNVFNVKLLQQQNIILQQQAQIQKLQTQLQKL